LRPARVNGVPISSVSRAVRPVSPALALVITVAALQLDFASPISRDGSTRPQIVDQ
jgi:hypothetical protein